MSNFATIKYPDINLIIDLSHNCSLYPLTVISATKKLVLSHSKYGQGICEIDGSACVVVNFSKFLNIKNIEKLDDQVVLKITGFSGDFALIIPIPKIIQQDLKFKTIKDKIELTEDHFPLVSSNYCVIEEEIYLKVSGAQIFECITEETSSFFTKKWLKSAPSWPRSLHDNLAKIAERSSLTQKSETAVIGSRLRKNNIIICKVGTYQFSLPEDWLFELQLLNKKITSIPNSPPWVMGAIDVKNESLPLLELKSWLNLDGFSVEDKLIVIVNYTRSIRFGLVCDSVDIIETPTNVPIQRFQEIRIDNLPFTNILQFSNKFVFSLNIDFLANSLSNSNITSIHNNWNIWREFFAIDDQNRLGLLNKGKEASEPEYASEHLEIKFRDINILMDLTKDVTLFDNKKGKLIQHYPIYCEGLIDLGGTPTLLIDFAKYLGIETRPNEQFALVKISDNLGSIALRIPTPKITRFNIKFKTSISMERKIDHSFKLPSSQYNVINGKIYLRLSQLHLFGFLENELKEALTNNWKDSIPHWESLRSDTLAKFKTVQTIMMPSSSSISAVVKEHKDNYLIGKIGDAYFAVNEDNVIDVIARDVKVTNLPYSPIWIDGVMNHQNEDIPLINTSLLLQTSNPELTSEIVLIVSISSKKIALRCNSIYSISGLSKISLRTGDQNFQCLPYSNIFEINGRVIFLLNLEYLERSIKGIEGSSDFEEWFNFLAIPVAQFHKDQVVIDRSQLFQKNSLLAIIDNSNYSIPLKHIITIRASSDLQRMSFEDIDLVAYNNEWIPAFNVKTYDFEENVISHDNSLILKIENLLFELQVDHLQLIVQGDTLIDQSTWDTLLGGKSPIGLKSPVETDLGMAYSLDLNDLVTGSFDSKAEKEFDIFTFLADLTIDPPEEIAETSIISKEMAQIWEDNIELYLIICENGETGNKYALHTNLISNINIDRKSETDEVIRWEHSELKSYFYVEIINSEKGEKVFQIPSNCHLRSIKSENIKSDNQVNYIIIEEEKIPLLNVN